jgi:hypothetical protein
MRGTDARGGLSGIRSAGSLSPRAAVAIAAGEAWRAQALVRATDRTDADFTARLLAAANATVLTRGDAATSDTRTESWADPRLWRDTGHR